MAMLAAIWGGGGRAGGWVAGTGCARISCRVGTRECVVPYCLPWATPSSATPWTMRASCASATARRRGVRFFLGGVEAGDDSLVVVVLVLVVLAVGLVLFLAVVIIVVGGGRAYSVVACLGHLTIDHASLARRSTVPTANRHLQHLGAQYAFSTCCKMLGGVSGGVIAACLGEVLARTPSHHIPPFPTPISCHIPSHPVLTRRSKR